MHEGTLMAWAQYYAMLFPRGVHFSPRQSILETRWCSRTKNKLSFFLSGPHPTLDIPALLEAARSFSKLLYVFLMLFK